MFIFGGEQGSDESSISSVSDTGVVSTSASEAADMLGAATIAAFKCPSCRSICRCSSCSKGRGGSRASSPRIKAAAGLAKAAYGASDEPERKIPRTIKVTKKAAAAARQKLSPVKAPGKPRGRAAARANALAAAAAAATSVATPSPFSGVRYRRRTSIDDYDDDAEANDDEVDGNEDEDDAGDPELGVELPDANDGDRGDSHGGPRGDDDDDDVDDGDAGLIGRERFGTLRMEPVSPMKTHPITVPVPTTTNPSAAAAVAAAIQQHQLQQLHQFQQHALQQHQIQQYQHTLTQLHWQQMQVCYWSSWG